MHYGHLIRSRNTKKSNMPRKDHSNDHTLPLGDNPNIYRVIYDEADDVPDEMFTNHKSKRSRKAFKVNEPNNNRLIIAAVVFMVLVCGAIFFLTESMRVDENRGCIASAYQATQNGFDLKANLSVCD